MAKVPGFAKAFAGRWRIIEMDNWDSDFLDLVEEAHLYLYEAAVVKGISVVFSDLDSLGYGCCARSSPAAAKRCAEDAGLEGALHP